MSPSKNCYELIKKFEGRVLSAYRDRAGIWTIGYGCTYYENGKPVKLGDTITSKRAESLFKHVVDVFSGNVTRLLKADLNPNQFDALVSFAYNVGIDIDNDNVPEGFGDSTLLKLVNKNPLDPLIRAEFAKWIKITVNGKKVVLNDLVVRRKIEADLYFKPYKDLLLSKQKSVN
jgi:lysozyme